MSQDRIRALVTSARPARPRLTSSLSLGSAAGSGRGLDVEAVLRRLPRDAGGKLARRRLQGACELDDGSQARLAPCALEQRDLRPVQLATVPQLFLRDADIGAGLAKICGKALLRTHGMDSLVLKTGTLQTESFSTPVQLRVSLLCSRGWHREIRIFTQKALSAGWRCVIPVRAKAERQSRVVPGGWR